MGKRFSSMELYKLRETGYPLNASAPYILWLPLTISRYLIGGVEAACSMSR